MRRVYAPPSHCTIEQTAGADGVFGAAIKNARSTRQKKKGSSVVRVHGERCACATRKGLVKWQIERIGDRRQRDRRYCFSTGGDVKLGNLFHVRNSKKDGTQRGEELYSLASGSSTSEGSSGEPKTGGPVLCRSKGSRRTSMKMVSPRLMSYVLSVADGSSWIYFP